MAPPKKKVSRSRQGKRRSHLGLSGRVPSLAICPRCKEPKLPHRVCIHCGYYRDREIIKMEKP